MPGTSLAIDGASPALADLPPFPSWPQAGDEEQEALLRVLHSGAWGSTHGTEVAAFEQEFAAAHDAEHAIALGNGTLAIVAALRAHGVGIGDEVIVPPYTFIATASAALFVGAIPVFADVDPRTHLMDPAAAEAVITERTKAIIPVHLAGNVANMTAFAELGARHGLAIIEDSAQAVGAAWQDRPVGTLGSCGTFSFQTSKNLTAGEGGIVTTNDEQVANRLYSLVNVGRVRGGAWYQHDSVGYNLRLTEFQGALLRVQLRHLDQMQQRRDRNARALAQALRIEGIELPAEDPSVTAHGRHLFIFRVPGLAQAGLRDAAVAALAAEGIPAPSTGYVPLHRNEAVLRETSELAQRLGQPKPSAHCPQTDRVAADTIWLTQNILLGSPDQVDAVAGAIIAVVQAAQAGALTP